jgi:8-oxo-dGTP pyrophosphatase MutT (NUDIX family)
MLLLIDNDGSLSLCLTRRNSHMKHHPGQISFPGGKMG